MPVLVSVCVCQIYVPLVRQGRPHVQTTLMERVLLTPLGLPLTDTHVDRHASLGQCIRAHTNTNKTVSAQHNLIV